MRWPGRGATASSCALCADWCMMRGPQPEARTQAGRFGTAHVHVLAVPAESMPLDSAEKPVRIFTTKARF